VFVRGRLFSGEEDEPITFIVLGESRLESVRGTFGLFGELRVETRA
jgi:hypothetical protein